MRAMRLNKKRRKDRNAVPAMVVLLAFLILSPTAFRLVTKLHIVNNRRAAVFAVQGSTFLRHGHAQTTFSFCDDGADDVGSLRRRRPRDAATNNAEKRAGTQRASRGR